LGVASVPLDGWVLLYAFGIALLTGVLVGLVPAISATRAQLVNSLRDGTRAVTSSTRARQALVVAQVAMSVVQLCGAGLLARSLLLMTTDPTGLTARDVLTMDVVLPVSRYGPKQQVEFFREALESLASLPGVRSVGAARDIPMSMARISGTSFRIDGEPEPPPNERLTTLVRVVTPGYFATLGIPLVQGREFTYEDPAAGSAPVFVVNESFAKRFLRARDPLAAALSVNMQGAENPYGTIVGVAGDVKDGSLRGTAEPTVFYSNSQLASPGMTLMIRTSRGPELAREAVDVIRRMDANLPVTRIRLLDSALGDSVARDRLNLVVMTAFAISALLLASLGLYGLLGYTVTERTSEIGLRMALGARAEQVLGMLMLHGLKLVAVGAILGLVGAAALGRLLESLLFGITARDPLTFAGVVLLLGIVCVVAALLPARRAAHVDPMVALRNE
jgi:predicted permease